MSSIADDVVRMSNGKYVWIDTSYLMFPVCGMNIETMVFECDKNGKVKEWQELDVLRYNNKEDAISGHDALIEKWRNK